MSQQLIKLIIGLLVFCLVMIIGFQFFWIRNAIKVKEEQFERAVSDALVKVAEKTQSHEVVSFISNKTGSNSYIDSLVCMSVPSPDTLVQTISCVHISKSCDSSNDDPDVEMVISDKKKTRKIVKSKNNLVISKKDSAESFLRITAIANLDDTEFFSGSTKSKKERFIKVMDKLIFEFSTKDESLEQKVDSATLDSLIKSELQNKNLPLKYEFAITVNDKDTIFPIRSPGFVKEMKQTTFKTNLFPDNIEMSPYKLMLFFPDKSSYILRSLLTVLAGSALFSFIIIITFIWAIHVILKQKKISDIKSDFINNMTHELKTPIATISIAVDSVNNPRVISDPEKVRPFLRIIKEENESMNSHVESVLQMALLDKREFNFTFQSVDIDTLVETATEKMRLQIQNREGTIQFDANAPGAVIEADGPQIVNVLINLLDNAVKYSPQAPEIKVTTRVERNSVVISVTDNGIGMSKEAQLKIFDKFYRVATGNIHSVKGFGLGLSYAKAIVLAHNGRILVKSELGKGSSFEVYLPLSKM